ncbi:MAG: hypothetical protein KGJ58_00785 [Patescibacteria group bacterium]|nr:hypothetical protein [Patescibacteria group bacterium]MDE1988159.1 hypothetical protein [Patescibacteria group bacterium]MDE2217979.1 hypothetical protein [Patescibacteria group bacterium]
MKKLNKRKIAVITGAAILLFFALTFQPIVSFAALDTEGGNNDSGRSGNIITLRNPLGNNINNLPAFIYMILDIVFRIGAIMAVLVLMYVGFMFVSARGDTEKLETARRAFLWTVIGIALLLGGRLIASIIGNTISQVSTGIY